MKFIADEMLGKTTRWLRILGQDIKYAQCINDEEIIEKAELEHRILLTRDFRLFQRASKKGLDCFLVNGKKDIEKLAGLSKKFNFKLDVDFSDSRCPKCNTKMRIILKDSVSGRVKKGTCIHHNKFLECTYCRQVYWQGTHWNGIKKKLNEIKQVIEFNKKNR